MSLLLIALLFAQIIPMPKNPPNFPAGQNPIAPSGFVTLNGNNTEEIHVKEVQRVPAEHWYSWDFKGIGVVHFSFPETDMMHPHCRRSACAMNVVDLQEKTGIKGITNYDKEGFDVVAPRGHYIEVDWVELKSTGPGDHFRR